MTIFKPSNLCISFCELPFCEQSDLVDTLTNTTPTVGVDAESNDKYQRTMGNALSIMLTHKLSPFVQEHC